MFPCRHLMGHLQMKTSMKIIRVFFTAALLFLVGFNITAQKNRARDLGIPFAGEPGPLNAITDVEGVEVGHSTIIEGHGENKIGEGPVRTGVTAIFPRGKKFNPVFANWYSLNGNGEMTGTTWITESGFLETPIMITNTNSVGVVRDAVLKWYVDTNWYENEELWYTYPVVAETYDGILNDIYGFHVKEKHVFEAIENADTTAVVEGNVGGGTGMMALGFKGGIGTASRKIIISDTVYTLGVLVQANFGAKRNLTIAGVPVGRELRDTLNYEISQPAVSSRNEGDGSIIVIVATDAPLLPHQLKRIVHRVPMGIALVGGKGFNGSGDIFLSFSTANPNAFNRNESEMIEMLPNDHIDPLLEATVQAVEESIVNALVAAKTMKGINGNTAYGLPHDLVTDLMKKYNRYNNEKKKFNLDLSAFTGKYKINEDLQLNIMALNDHLFVTTNQQAQPLQLNWKTKDQFEGVEKPLLFSFQKNGAGSVIGVKVETGENTFSAEKIK